MTILPNARMITSSLWFFSFFLDGLYTIKPGHRQVQTFCKFSDHGGAWTLVLTSASDNGWARDNVKSRNIHNPSLSSDFSLLGMADNITKMKHFQVRTYQHVNQLFQSCCYQTRLLNFESFVFIVFDGGRWRQDLGRSLDRKRWLLIYLWSIRQSMREISSRAGTLGCQSSTVHQASATSNNFRLYITDEC